MRHSFIDAHSNIESILRYIDPRIKIITFILFILFIILTPANSLGAFGLYLVIILALALLSKIPFYFILKKSLTVIPFVLMIALFAIVSKDTDKFLNIFIKAYLAVLCMILLVSSTPFAVLLKALERLRFPKLMVMIISFMYRYIFVIEDELDKMKMAKESRSCARSKWLENKALANILGVLFIRSYERAEAVYLAMCSRGFDGEIRTLDDFKIELKDLAFIVCVLVSLALIRFVFI